jgi:hypothetical protein
LAPGLAALAVLSLLFAGPARGADPETLDRLEKIIEQQQRQIENQQKTLEDLQNQVEALKDRPGQTAVESSGGRPAVVEPGNPKAYLGYRFHKLDRSGADFENVNAVMTGMRVKF